MRTISSTSQERILSVLSPLLLLGLWQLCSNLGLIDRRFFPSPYSIFISARELVNAGELLPHITASLYRLAAGFVIGAIPGIILGMVMGLNRTVRAVVDPIIAATYPIPKIAILPLLMILFGIGDGSKIAAVAIAVFFLMVINTMVGVIAIERVFFDVAKNFNSPWYKLFSRVILPASLPTIFGGLRISLGVSLIVLVAAEFVASRAGIGFMIWSSWETLMVDRMFVGIIIITILGVLSTTLLKEIERRVVPWKQTS